MILYSFSKTTGSCIPSQKHQDLVLLNERKDIFKPNKQEMKLSSCRQEMFAFIGARAHTIIRIVIVYALKGVSVPNEQETQHCRRRLLLLEYALPHISSKPIPHLV